MREARRRWPSLEVDAFLLPFAAEVRFVLFDFFLVADVAAPDFFRVTFFLREAVFFFAISPPLRIRIIAVDCYENALHYVACEIVLASILHAEFR